jgi:hypothetical protein
VNTVKFLGASVLSFDSSVGWGDQSSTLRVQLVEDIADGDEFTSENQIGFPVRFDFNGWIFDGILNEFSAERSTSGNRLLSVTLISPTEIVKGVKLILNNSIEDIQIPNIYNVFGQVERNSGYGSSGVNVFGFPYRGIYDTLIPMVNQRPITSKGFSYLLDLTRLPALPNDYRVSGDILSLYEYIEDVCEAGAHDFFIELVGNIIVVRTVSRQLQPELGRITQFIEDQTNLGLYVSSSNTGLENEYNVSTRLLYGAPREDIFYSYAKPFDIDDENYSFADDNVAWFFGLNELGNIVTPFIFEETLTVGNDVYDPERKVSFILNGYPVSFPNPDDTSSLLLDFRSGYPSDEEEIQAAMASQEAWESYLVLKDHPGSIHYNKARRIGIVSNTRPDILEFIGAKVNDLDKFKNLTAQELFNFGNRSPRNESMISHVYQYIKSIGDDFYGRKFTVKIPNIFIKVEENGTVVTSLEPINSGYIDDSVVINDSVPPKNKDLLVQERFKALKIFPENPFVLFTEDGKVSAYMKCFSIGIPGENSPESFSDPNGHFIKVSVDPELVFINRATGAGPRVVITSPVFIRDRPKTSDQILQSMHLYKFLRSVAFKKLGDNDGQTFIDKLFSMSGADMIYNPVEGYSGLPDFVAVPLKNNLKTYGPWFTKGGIGRAEIINDETVAPWVFGGHYQMNVIAESIVNQSYSERFTGESGSITVVGAPSIRIGSELVSSGPYVTDINVTVNGSNGVMTTYRMNRWSTNSDKLLRYNIEKLKEINKIKNQRKFKIGQVGINKNQSYQKFREVLFPQSLNNRSSSNCLVTNTSVSNDQVTTEVNIMPNYNAARSFSTDEGYKNVAGMSIDGLLRPFSTNKNEQNLPKFEIKQSETIPSSLNPFRSGNDISFLAHGQVRPEDFSNIDYEDIRAVGLRAPIILVGYGYDKNDKPVPNTNPSNPTNNFRSDYLSNTKHWKAGPLDVRWDNDLGIWQATGGAKMAIVRALEDVNNSTEYFNGHVVQEIFGSVSGVISIHNPSAGLPNSGGDVTSQITVERIFQLKRGMSAICVEAPKLGTNKYLAIQAGGLFLDDCPSSG